MRRRLAICIAAFSMLTPALRADSLEEVYAKNCLACHGKDGKGNTPAGRKVGAKDLTVSKTSHVEVEKQIFDGKLDPKGVAKMPAFRGKLSDEDIKGLATYILRFRKAK